MMKRLITIEDLIRRDGREPGGGWPKTHFEITHGLAVRDPKAVERIHPFTLVDIAKRRNS
jgi:hypothetical protein